MDEIDEIGSTAFLIAELRALEATQTTPLFSDPYAAVFYNQESSQALNRYNSVAPFFGKSVRMRTRWFDDTVNRCVDEGYSQILILGAGFDCRALRFSRSGVTFFEVDQPGVMRYKSKVLREAMHNHNAVIIESDYTDPEMIDLLVKNGFQLDKKTLVIWEGNTYYLPPALIRSVLQGLRNKISTLRVAFDFFGTSVIEGNSVSPSMKAAIPILKRIGAPWHGGIDNVNFLAEEVGMKVEEHFTADEIHKLLLIEEQNLGQDSGVEYGLCIFAN